MITTSADFRAASRATTRKPRARVEVTWLDVYSRGGVAPTAIGSYGNRISYAPHVVNSTLETPYKWAILNEDTILDGTFHPAPGTPETRSQYEVGFVGSLVGDSSGDFEVDYRNYLSVAFTPRKIYGVRVVGDTSKGEYPVDFQIVFRIGISNSGTRYVTGNTETICNIKFDTPSETLYDGLLLVVTKWSHPNRVIKISEFGPHYSTIYKGDDIVSLKLAEEMEVSDGTLPIGNISSAELDLQLQNIDNTFYPGNTASQLDQLVKSFRNIRAWLGFVLPVGSTDVSSGSYLVETESGRKVGYVPIGQYWSGDWQTQDLGPSVTTAARDRIEVLRGYEYESEEILIDNSVYDIAVSIFVAAQSKLPDLKYYISPVLKNTVIPYAWFPRGSYYDALKMLAQACLGYCYADKNGVIIFRESVAESYHGTGTMINSGFVLYSGIGYNYGA